MTLELRDICVSYDDDAVLKHVSVEVPEGELVVLSGRTGSGKSTLLGVITGLVPAFTGGHLSGDVLLDGRSIVRLPPRERAHTIGYVGQDPLAGFVTDTVEEELAYGMEQLGVDAATMRRRVEETLDLLGIADLRQRDLRTLSGGQQQRVAIGSVLTMHPRVLVLDEPTSALDPTAAEDVLATVSRLVHDLGVSVIMAEHRLERVVPFADAVWLLEGDGHLVCGPPAAVLASSPVVPPIVELGRIAEWEPLPLSVRAARRAADDLRASLPAHPNLAAPHRTTSTATSSPTPAVSVHRLDAAYDGRRALREVSLDLPTHDITALMGRNGAGKSTLLWALQGSRPRAKGSVSVHGTDPTAQTPAARRRLVGLVPQSASDLLYLETVAMECREADQGTGATPGTCRALLDALVPGLDERIHPRDLSEGSRLALALAIILTADPQVVLLDEPTRGLDYPGKHALALILRRLAEQGRSVVVATHDVEFAAQVADSVVVLADGEVVSSGPARTVLTQSPAFAPQVTKILGAPWLKVDDVRAALTGQSS